MKKLKIKNRDAQKKRASHKAVESVLRPEGSLWWERFVEKGMYNAIYHSGEPTYIIYNKVDIYLLSNSLKLRFTRVKYLLFISSFNYAGITFITHKMISRRPN